MTRSSGRTRIAMAAVVLGVGGPLAYAGLMGHQAAEAEAAELRRAPRIEAEQAAARVAERLGDRLATLVEQESERPFFHYQNFIVDPRGAYEGTAVVPSPLNDAGGDALIAAHFQVDPAGRVTMPRVVEGVADAAPPAERDVELLASLRLADIPRPAAAPIDEPVEVVGPPIVAALDVVPALDNRAKNVVIKKGGGKGSRAVQQVVLPEEQYQQNVDANELYNAIQSKSPSRGKVPAQELPAPQPAQQAALAPVTQPRDVVVRVGPLGLETTTIAGSPALVAVRAVETPDGARTQGFVVDPSALASLTAEVAPGALLMPPADAARAVGAKVKLPGVDWRVVVPFAAAQAVADAEAEALVSDFRLRFAGMSVLALLAMAAVVWALWLGERHLERRQRFAAAAAHELRTPLAGLRMYAEMLAHGLGKPDKQKVYAERLATEAGRLGRVVANVLDFTNMERGNLSVKPVPGDLAATVAEQVARLEPAIRASGATLDVSASASVSARFDADAVHQIVQNLVDNAEKYGRASSDRAIQVRVADAADGPEVVVRDHGPGLPPRFESRLFVPFARGDVDGPAGLGLGLALTRALARAQGGDVSFRRPPDGGAEFRLVLPRA